MIGKNNIRDYYFDNIKFILILSVVFGHLINSFAANNPFFKVIYFIIYSFHIPLFVFISGYFSKRSISIKKLLCSIFIPYVLFQILYKLFQQIMIGTIYNITDIFTPYWLMWFLFSLFTWKLLIMVIKKISIKPIYIITFSIFLVIAIGFDREVGDFLAIRKTVTFLPFFLMGYYFKRKYVDSIKRINKLEVLLISLILSSLISFLILKTNTNVGWLQANLSYDKLGYTTLSIIPIIYEIIAISINILFGIIILNKTPDKKMKFSCIGTNSIYIYLLHGFIIRTISYKGGLACINLLQNNVLILTALFLMSITIMLFTTSKFIIRIVKPLVKPTILI